MWPSLFLIAQALQGMEELTFSIERLLAIRRVPKVSVETNKEHTSFQVPFWPFIGLSPSRLLDPWNLIFRATPLQRLT